MQWFSGNINEAINLCKTQNSIFIVLVEAESGSHDSANDVWNDQEVKKFFNESQYVALRLKSDSELAKQFSQIYPVFIYPTLYFIGNRGQPLETKVGQLTVSGLIESAKRAFELHEISMHPITAPNAPTSEVVTSATTATLTSNAAHEAEPIKNSAAEITVPIDNGDASTASSDPLNSESVTTNNITSVAANSVGKVASSAAEVSSDDQHLTLEEKTEKAKQILAEKQAAKAAKEAELQRQKELERRKLGQDLNKLKDLKMEMERKELERELKEKKEADRLAREQVRKQLQLDREERAKKFYSEKNEIADQQIQKENERIAAEKEKLEKERALKMSVARIQFRFPDGSSMTHQFNSSDNLSSARSFVLQSKPGVFKNISLSTIHPRKVFSGDDYDQTFLHHNLAPSSVLVVLPSAAPTTQSTAVVGSNDTSGNILYTIWTQIMFIINYLISFILPTTGNNNDPNATAPTAAAAAATATTAASTTPQPHTSTSSSPTSVPFGGARPKTKNTNASSDGLRQRKEGNIHRLTADDEDDEQATWNGNSTQQM